MTSVRSLIRWVLLVGPARFYKRGEEAGGIVPHLHTLAFLAFLAGALAVGIGVGWLLGDPESGALTAIIVAGVSAVAWGIYTLGLVAVLRCRGVPLETLAGDEWLRRRRNWWDR